jgi:hypothetical protein
MLAFYVLDKSDKEQPAGIKMTGANSKTLYLFTVRKRKSLNQISRGIRK